MAELDRSVSVKRLPGAHTQSIANRRGHTLLADEPASLGGGDRGFSPFELVTAGLGACTSITLLMYAERKGMGLDDVAVDLRFYRRGEGGFARDTIRRQIRIAGNLEPESIERLKAVARRCPVHLALEPAIDIVDDFVVATA